MGGKEKSTDEKSLEGGAGQFNGKSHFINRQIDNPPATSKLQPGPTKPGLAAGKTGTFNLACMLVLLA